MRLNEGEFNIKTSWPRATATGSQVRGTAMPDIANGPANHFRIGVGSIFFRWAGNVSGGRRGMTMEPNDEICAFVINGRHVCFHCYDPNTDKDEDVLSSTFFAQTNQSICSRCNRVIRPERRVINRRDDTDRRSRQVSIDGPDRRSGEDRRQYDSRRKKR